MYNHTVMKIKFAVILYRCVWTCITHGTTIFNVDNTY